MRSILTAGLIAAAATFAAVAPAQATCLHNNTDLETLIGEWRGTMGYSSGMYHTVWMKKGDMTCEEEFGGLYRFGVDHMFEGPYAQVLTERLDNVYVTGNCQDGLVARVITEFGTERGRTTLPGPIPGCR